MGIAELWAFLYPQKAFSFGCWEEKKILYLDLLYLCEYFRETPKEIAGSGWLWGYLCWLNLLAMLKRLQQIIILTYPTLYLQQLSLLLVHSFPDLQKIPKFSYFDAAPHFQPSQDIPARGFTHLRSHFSHPWVLYSVFFFVLPTCSLV